MIDAGAVTEWRRGLRQPGLVDRAVCQLLRELAAAVPANEAVVELGAYRGRTTGWLLLGAGEGRGAHVTTVDPWTLLQGRPDYGDPEVYHDFRAHMHEIGATRETLTIERAYAADVGRAWSGPQVGLLWHDADHSADDVAADLEAWLPHLSDTAVIVLHDATHVRDGRDYYEVEIGAARVLADSPDWDWDGRALVRDEWDRRSWRRGALIVRRRAV